jgi:glycosyltransferase involved in cell wall biosynthesis
MEGLWLSVIIPSHDGERWLRGALQSVLNQNSLGIEVIVIDSSASANCRRIAEAFADKLDIQFHARPDLLPWTAKTNFGASRAKGEWLCILHQDDFWLPNRCAELRNWLRLHPDAIMHLHPSYIVGSTGKILGLWRCPLPDGSAPIPAEILLRRLLVQNFVAVPAPTIRRTAFLNVGGLDEQLWYTADWDLYLKIIPTGAVFYHNIPLSCFRVHNTSQTISGSRNIEDFKKQHQIVLNRYAGQVSLRAQTLTLRLAAASVEVNTALAEAINGNPVAIIRALRAVFCLSPADLMRYIFYSRLLDRLIPRLRARLRAEW